MSFTRTVPSGVPSLLQSSWPVISSVARKNKIPFAAVRSCGTELSLPGLMSFTSLVPVAVPSLLQSSHPVLA